MRIVKKLFALLLTLLLVPSLSANALKGDAVSIRVAAAADLTDAFKEIAARYTQKSGCRVDLIFGASGQLTQQIEHGAPYDVFASASSSYIQELSLKHLTLPDTEKIYAIGKLVVWFPEGSKLSLKRIQDLNSAAIHHISIANPQHAPYGKAALEAIRKSGLYSALQPKLVYGENVRQAFQFAQTGNAEACIVSASIVVGKGNSFLIPAVSYNPILQTIAALKSTQHEREARGFTQFLLSADGRAILKKYSFSFPLDKKQKPAH